MKFTGMTLVRDPRDFFNRLAQWGSISRREFLVTRPTPCVDWWTALFRRSSGGARSRVPGWSLAARQAREGETHLAEPRFVEFAGLLSELQELGAVGFELEQDPATQHDMLFFYADKNLDETTRHKQQLSRELIGLSDHKAFRVLYAPFAVADDVLAIQTRSVVQMLLAMAKFVDVPPDKASRAVPGYILPEGVSQPFQVYSSSEKPVDAFASVRYHGDWYWIDHDDLTSKRVFVLMLFLTTLTNQASDQNQPVLTIPTN